MLCSPLPNRFDDGSKLTTVHWLEIQELIAKGHSEGSELIEHIQVRRCKLHAILQQIDEFHQVVRLSKSDSLGSKDRFETFFDCLLRVKPDGFVIAIGNFGKLATGLEITISQG
jgi:hypothetical protein